LFPIAAGILITLCARAVKDMLESPGDMIALLQGVLNSFDEIRNTLNMLVRTRTDHKANAETVGDTDMKIYDF
jgi:hypothetical protein